MRCYAAAATARATLSERACSVIGSRLLDSLVCLVCRCVLPAIARHCDDTPAALLVCCLCQSADKHTSTHARSAMVCQGKPGNTRYRHTDTPETPSSILACRSQYSARGLIPEPG